MDIFKPSQNFKDTLDRILGSEPFFPEECMGTPKIRENKIENDVIKVDIIKIIEQCKKFGLRKVLRHIEYFIIATELINNSWNVAKTARSLGERRTTIVMKIKSLRIKNEKKV